MAELFKSKRAAKARDIMVQYGKDKRRIMELDKILCKLENEINCPPSVQAMKYGWGTGFKGGKRSSVVERYELRKERLQERYNTLYDLKRDLEFKTAWVDVKIGRLHNEHHDAGLLIAFYVSNLEIGEIADRFGRTPVGCVMRIEYLLENVIPKILTESEDHIISYPD